MTRMEDLTTTQIVLLTLLTSFVTSIATGIITTSLLAEAPVSVTQTINRVVERTFETVVPTSSEDSVKEVTVVKEDDAIIASIDSSTQSVVRIIEHSDFSETPAFESLGVILSSDGTVLADPGTLISSSEYTVRLPDGTEFAVTPNEENDQEFKITPQEGRISFSPIKISENSLKLGQTVISLGGESNNTVAVGRVTLLDGGNIETDISRAGVRGEILLNLSGELVGMKISPPGATLVPGVYSTIASVIATEEAE